MRSDAKDLGEIPPLCCAK